MGGWVGGAWDRGSGAGIVGHANKACCCCCWVVGRGSWVMGRGSCVLLVGLASYVVDRRSLVALCGLCVLGPTPGH